MRIGENRFFHKPFFVNYLKFSIAFSSRRMVSVLSAPKIPQLFRAREKFALPELHSEAGRG